MGLLDWPGTRAPQLSTTTCTQTTVRVGLDPAGAGTRMELVWEAEQSRKKKIEEKRGGKGAKEGGGRQGRYRDFQNWVSLTTSHSQKIRGKEVKIYASTRLTGPYGYNLGSKKG